MLVARRVGFGKDGSHFGACEPVGQGTTLAQEFFAHLGAGDRGRTRTGGNFGNFFVTRFIGQVDQFPERHHADTEFFTVLIQEFLRVVRSVEWLAGGIDARPGMITPHDEVIGTMVAADKRMPKRLARPGQAHGERQQ